MTMTVSDDVVHLCGYCPAEDAEALLPILAAGARTVDLTGCDHLHAAVFQLLMATGCQIIGEPAPVLAQWIVPQLTGPRTA